MDVKHEEGPDPPGGEGTGPTPGSAVSQGVRTSGPCLDFNQTSLGEGWFFFVSSGSRGSGSSSDWVSWTGLTLTVSNKHVRCST